MAGRAGAVRQAELRKVRSPRGFRAARTIRSLCSSVICGLRTARCAGTQRYGKDASTMRQLAGNLSTTYSSCCLRVGVQSRIGRIRKAGYRDCWFLYVEWAENQVAFLTKVGVHGARGVKANRVLDELALGSRRPGRRYGTAASLSERHKTRLAEIDDTARTRRCNANGVVRLRRLEYAACSSKTASGGGSAARTRIA